MVNKSLLTECKPKWYLSLLCPDIIKRVCQSHTCFLLLGSGTQTWQGPNFNHPNNKSALVQGVANCSLHTNFSLCLFF